ncbi:hypothetical protein DSM19430T_18440 [Desulfovibrio psychrotolerans]|uniref:Uncharacterized protein n=1 Tax=Desulfovibrio psychrotolerans TaxID=415242 RepID=A0A7J0BTX0_9BACT|nr:hypothetical protein DSM19430T_18440 [Desulfovibrio psychrotolerans]
MRPASLRDTRRRSSAGIRTDIRVHSPQDILRGIPKGVPKDIRAAQPMPAALPA